MTPLLSGTQNGEKVETLTLKATLKDWDWSYVAISYDAKTKKAVLMLQEKPFAPGDQFSARNLTAEMTIPTIVQQGPPRCRVEGGFQLHGSGRPGGEHRSAI